jgi:hypothetical protein
MCCLIAVLSSCFRLKIRRFVHPKTASLKKNSIKFADSIFLTTFDFRSLILSRKRSGLVGNVASVGLQRFACNLSVQRRLCRSALFFFFQRDFTCTWDSNPASRKRSGLRNPFRFRAVWVWLFYHFRLLVGLCVSVAIFIAFGSNENEKSKGN